MKILGFEIRRSKQSNISDNCSHEKYTYKYNPDNEDLYTCDKCGLVGKLTGGERVPNSYNMITGDYAYRNRVFNPLNIENWNKL